MEKMREIVNQTGIGETHNLEKYPRFPIIHKGRRRNEFQFVVERIQAKLVGWKSKCLSLTGRLVLIKAAVSSILGWKKRSSTWLDGTRLALRLTWGVLEFLKWKPETLPSWLSSVGELPLAWICLGLKCLQTSILLWHA